MGFSKTNARIDQLGFVRGPAMVYVAPLSQAHPSNIGDVIRLTGTEVDEVQTLTGVGSAASGTFSLAFKGDAMPSGALPYSASAAQVQTALEALATVGPGNVLCAGGPLPGTPVTVTFQGTLAKAQQPMLVLAKNSLAGGTTPTVTIAETTPGLGIYDPMGAWTVLGATADGVNTTYSNEEESFTMDQKVSIIGKAPTQHNWGMTTNFLQVDLDNLATICDMGPVTLDTTPAVPEKVMGMGAPSSYTPRRLAVIHRRPEIQGGLLRMHYFRLAVRGSAEVSLNYASTGPQQRIAARFDGLVDDNISDEYLAIGYIRDQV